MLTIFKSYGIKPPLDEFFEAEVKNYITDSYLCYLQLLPLLLLGTMALAGLKPNWLAGLSLAAVGINLGLILALRSVVSWRYRRLQAGRPAWQFTRTFRNKTAKKMFGLPSRLDGFEANYLTDLMVKASVKTELGNLVITGLTVPCLVFWPQVAWGGYLILVLLNCIVFQTGIQLKAGDAGLLNVKPTSKYNPPAKKPNKLRLLGNLVVMGLLYWAVVDGKFTLVGLLGTGCYLVLMGVFWYGLIKADRNLQTYVDKHQPK